MVCFPTRPGERSAAPIPPWSTRIRRGLQRALEVSGAGWVSTTTLRRAGIPARGIVNYLSTDADADRVVDTLLDASERVLEQLDLGTART